MALIPQLIGKDPAQIEPMAEALRALGHTRLNLNIGCPWKFVAKKGRGSGLLRDPDLLRRMLEAGCKAMPDGFSVKVRLGIDTPMLLAERIDIFNEFPLSAVVVHPRTAAQMYEGDVDLDAFAEVLPRLKAPVVYNGDIRTADDFLRLRERFPTVAGWMIGRGAVSDPLLPQKIRRAVGEPSCGVPVEDEFGTLRAFHDALYAEYRAQLFGPSPVLGRMKELWGYLHVRFPDGATVLRRIQRSKTLEEFERHARTAFEGVS